MRRILLIYTVFHLLGAVTAQAQQYLNTGNNAGRDRYGNLIDPSTQPDSLKSDTEIQSLPPKLYMWRISETLGNRTIIPADTLTHNFQNSNLVEGFTGHYNYLGNLGSTRQSRLFFERDDEEVPFFLRPYANLFMRPDQLNFTNSNIPFTNLTYYKAGNKINGEERFKSYFSVNANKALAFGFHVDYQYGRGYYSNQSTAHFNAGLFGSYIGERYQMHLVYNYLNTKMNENGGIANDGYITRPDTMAEGKKEYESTNIPVKLEKSTNRNKNFHVYLTQRYRLGFKRRTLRIEGNETKKTHHVHDHDHDHAHSHDHEHDHHDGEEMHAATASADTITVEEFVPVTSFIHTFKLERTHHSFNETSEASDFYEHSHYNTQGTSRDSTTAISMKNVFGIALLEGFNKYAKAGLTAYLAHKYSRYELMNADSVSTDRFSEHEMYVGGELSKTQGSLLHYNITGEVGFLDTAIGQFRLQGNLDFNFRLGKDTVQFIARGHVKNTLPHFYMRHYRSNHFIWDNSDMSKEFRTRAEAELKSNRLETVLRAGVENIKNYTYFDQKGLPAQYSDNIQVVSATLTKNFRLGIFHLDNEVTWQQSSNSDILPLPKLSLYHNFYLQTKLAKKVLNLQLGADVRYFTAYHAPAYMPATQQFHLQSEADRVDIGGYPIVNVYANLHLKRTRFFAMMYHVNQGMGKRNYFLVPHYPINPTLFKVGLSWNFFD